MSDPSDSEAAPLVVTAVIPTRAASSSTTTSRGLSVLLLILLCTALLLFLLSVYRVQLQLGEHTRGVQRWKDAPIATGGFSPLFSNAPPTLPARAPPTPETIEADQQEDVRYYAGRALTSAAEVAEAARSAVAEHAAALIPSPPAHTNLSIIIAHLSSYTIVYDYGGVGCSGWALEANLLLYGLSLFLPASSLHAITSPWECSGLPPWVADAIHALSSKPLPANIDILITHRPPPGYTSFPSSSWGRVIRQRPRYIVGRSMTEVHRVPSSWGDAINRLVDECWLTSSQQLAPFLLGGALPSRLFVVPEPVDVRLWDAQAAEPPQLSVAGLRAFNWLAVGKLEERKGFRELLYAWFSEFSADEDVALFVHTYAHNAAGDPRNAHRLQQRFLSLVHSLNLSRPLSSLPFNSTHVITRELPTALMPSFYRTFSAFVLPTHGEAWGLPLAEALLSALPVVATNSSGLLDFVDDSVGWLVPVVGWERARGPEWRDEDGGLWASASVSALRKTMRRVVNDRVEREARAKRGMARMREKYSVEAVAERMLRRLHAITAVVDERRQ